MALIKCSGCGHMISDKASKCPKCGMPIEKVESVFTEEKKETVNAEVNNPKADPVLPDGKEAENTRKKKNGIVAAICGIAIVVLAVGAFLLWKNSNGFSSEYEPQLVDGHPVYSAKLVKYAQKGNPDAQCDLGECLLYGYGVEEDNAEAVRWFRKAAEQGHAVAQYHLADCYEDGIGVEEDDAEAFRWLHSSAENGFAEAQFCVGECYYEGDFVKQDYNEAIRWYRMAAEQGDPRAKGALKVIDQSKKESNRNVPAGLTIRTFTQKRTCENGSTVQSQLENETIAANLKELRFNLIDRTKESRLDYTGESYYDVTIELYSKTINGNTTTVKLDEHFTEIHFPNLDDVEDFKKSIRESGMKERENGFMDDPDVYWDGTNVEIKGTVVELNYVWEP